MKQNIMACRENGNFLRPLGYMAFVAICTIIAYHNSFRGQFILDDLDSILWNPSLKHFWDSFTPPATVNIFRRQFVNVTLAINYAISGYDVWSYHLFNLIIHVANALLLYALLSHLLLRTRLAEWYGSHHRMLAAAAATIWAVHPLQTQAVTYVIQRCESLGATFVLATLLFSIRSFESPKPLLYRVGAVGSMILGVWVKESIILGPILALLYDRCFLSSCLREAVRRNRVLYLGFMVGLAVLVANLLAFLSASGETRNLGPLGYAASQPEIILHYLLLSFWPSRLCLDYGWTYPGLLPSLPYIAAVLALLVGSGWLAWKKHPYSFFLWWFWLTLAPSSSFVPIKDLAFEQRMYLSLFGLVSVCVLASYDLCRLFTRRFGGHPLLAAPVLWLGLSVVLTVGTIHRNEDYAKGQLHMWKDVIAQRPKNPRAWVLAAVLLAKKGKTEEAIDYYEKAIDADPDYILAHHDLAFLYGQTGEEEMAIRHLREMIRIQPQMTTPYFTLASTYMKRGDIVSAVDLLEKLAKINPGLLAVHAQLAQIYYKMGQYDKAASHLEAYLATSPGNRAAQLMLDRIKSGF